MLKLILSDCVLKCSPAPEAIYGTDQVGFTARVDFMGGQFKQVANPHKFDGAAKDVEFEVTYEAAAQTYGAKKETGRQAGAFVRPDFRLVAIKSAKLAK